MKKNDGNINTFQKEEEKKDENENIRQNVKNIQISNNYIEGETKGERIQKKGEKEKEK